jgi:DNA-binding beta-propeller fold protein YncE
MKFSMNSYWWTAFLSAGLVGGSFFHVETELAASSVPEEKGLSGPLSPTALAINATGEILYVACGTAPQVMVVDTSDRTVLRTWKVPEFPSGLALSADGKRLYVTCASPESAVCEVETVTGTVLRTLSAGHTALAPVLSPDGRTLYVCNRFNNEVVFFDLKTGRPARRVRVAREPVAEALTRDGRFLLVANHLHNSRADLEVVAATVSVIDTTRGKVTKELKLPNGSGLLRGVAVSPDGKFAAVTHQISRFHLPTTQIERGWINNNALSLIYLEGMKLVNTVLLDTIDRGAANPWATAWTEDGARILVTHAGTHELSVINAPALLAKLARLPESVDPTARPDYTVASHVAADVPQDLSFLVGLRRRIPWPDADRGPRALVVAGSKVYVANYFSDSLSLIDWQNENQPPASLALRPAGGMSLERRGELCFNDATLSFQGWQSCASCHSSDARMDGLNWDNLNDGIGNPKNVKSLLWAPATPPSMALGVRANAEVAVRAGIRHSLFTVQPETVATAIVAYLKSLQPLPSPYRVQGGLSPAAERGERLFRSESVGCADCHRPPLYTDGKLHDVGTRNGDDQPQDRFDTPTLVEAWRTAPYLHDGSALTVRDVLTSRNPKKRHGDVSDLTEEQLSDLILYVLSL